MKYKAIVFATFLIAAFLAPVMAQGLDAAGVQSSLSPLTALIEGIMRVGWDLTQMFIGKDDASIAYFTHQLGFRKDEVTMNVTAITYEEQTPSDYICAIGSFTTVELDETPSDLSDDLFVTSIQCTDITSKNKVFVYGSNSVILFSDITDSDKNNKIDLIDVFEYMINNEYGELTVTNNAKGQVMLFALLLPLGMLWFILQDFLMSTGLLRGITVKLVSLGIALLAARSGAYTGLLSMISSLFGSGGFFMSMLSIYLLIAIIMWFYGGVLRSKAIAEKSEDVAEAVVAGFTADLRRGMISKDAAKGWADADKKKKS